MADTPKPKKPRPLDVPLSASVRAALNKAAVRNHRSAAAQAAVYVEMMLREQRYIVEVGVV